MTESRDILRPTDLGEAGNALWVSMGGPKEDNPARIVLLVQAARLVDRLWAYDRVIHGDDEFLVREVDSGGTIIVRVDNVAVQERITTATLRQVISQLMHTEPSKSPENATPEADPKVKPSEPADFAEYLRIKQDGRMTK